MYDLNLKKMCKNTASDKMHIWFPNKTQKTDDNADVSTKKSVQSKQIKSIETDDVELAIVSYERGGASLYFGSSLEFRNKYCKALAYQMGMNFGAYFPDFSTMGEIETFWSRKGNLTDYHIDF